VDREDSKTRFANVVLPHLDDAYGLARWVTGNRADAEDVVQEACVRALRGIAGFAGGNARAWVLAIGSRSKFPGGGSQGLESMIQARDDIAHP
jgi:RNA polymerase sigma-70 factor (ECF subfamily)